jgi:acyl-CoA thioesterase FadM
LNDKLKVELTVSHLGEKSIRHDFNIHNVTTEKDAAKDVSS